MSRDKHELPNASEQRASVLAELPDALDTITEILRTNRNDENWRKLRWIVWSIYSDKTPITLRYAFDLDACAGEAVLKVIRAKLYIGNEVEHRLKRVLADSGEFDRYAEAEARAEYFGGGDVMYPLVPFDSDQLEHWASIMRRWESID